MQPFSTKVRILAKQGFSPSTGDPYLYLVIQRISDNWLTNTEGEFVDSEKSPFAAFPTQTRAQQFVLDQRWQLLKD